MESSLQLLHSKISRLGLNITAPRHQSVSANLLCPLAPALQHFTCRNVLQWMQHMFVLLPDCVPVVRSESQVSGLQALCRGQTGKCLAQKSLIYIEVMKVQRRNDL